MAEAPSKPVYLLTGDDRPKIDTALVRLRGHFAPEAVEVVSALETAGAAAVALCNTGSLFGDARLVVVTEVDGRRDADGRRKGGWKAADVEAVSAYLQAPAPATVLALVAEELKAGSALWKACARAGDVLEYRVPRKKLQSWVMERFRRAGVRAEPDACAALIQIVGTDLHALAAEVDKLATWAAGEPVGEREVEALAAPVAEDPIFALTDAWAAHDTARALAASERIFEREPRTRRDTAARLAAALGAHLGRLRSVKQLQAEGVAAAQAAGRLRLHPFYATRLYAQADGLTEEELRAAVVALARLDGALKGQSRLAPDLELQRTLVELTRRSGAPASRA
jgi:DNA polymerase-3 subunit delta